MQLDDILLVTIITVLVVLIVLSCRKPRKVVRRDRTATDDEGRAVYRPEYNSGSHGNSD